MLRLLQLGDNVKIRRYKDLCCEFRRFPSGTIISGSIFAERYIDCCGKSFAVRGRDVWDGSYAYRLSLPHDRNYWFKDFLLEEYEDKVGSNQICEIDEIKIEDCFELPF